MNLHMRTMVEKVQHRATRRSNSIPASTHSAAISQSMQRSPLGQNMGLLSVDASSAKGKQTHSQVATTLALAFGRDFLAVNQVDNSPDTETLSQPSGAIVQCLEAGSIQKSVINYEHAMKLNKKYASTQGGFGWASRLPEILPALDVLWRAEKYDEFADAVACMQRQAGLPEKDADGVMGPLTWDRVRPIGEVIASMPVHWEESQLLCSMATEERLINGYKRATGEDLISRKQWPHFNIILQSDTSQILKVDEKYRATGAAGALVYAGKADGEILTNTDIWDKKLLRSGAAIQVWEKKAGFEAVKKGQAIIRFGTSFVFVKYVGNDEMLVLHYDFQQKLKRSKFEVWIGANLRSRSFGEEGAAIENPTNKSEGQ